MKANRMNNLYFSYELLESLSLSFELYAETDFHAEKCVKDSFCGYRPNS